MPPSNRNPSEPLLTEADYRAALVRVGTIFQAQPGEPEFEELNVLVTLIETYEEQHYPMLS